MRISRAILPVGNTAPTTKALVYEQIRFRRNGVLETRMRPGTPVVGICVPVLNNTNRSTRSGFFVAHPSETGPPQSCAMSVTGVSTCAATSKASRSSMRIARVRAPFGRLEKPMPNWSIAITRHSLPNCLTMLRHMYDHVGFPWTHTMVPRG